VTEQPRLHRTRPAAAVVVIVVLLVGIIAPPKGASSRMLSLLFNSGHAVVFAAVALALLVILRRLWPERSPVFHFVAAGLGACALGAGVEVVQYFGPRDADLGDVGRDALGAAAAMVAAAGWERRARWGWSLGLLGVVLFGAAFTPVFALAAARLHRAAEFPRLAEFDSWREQPLFSWQGSEVTVGPAPAGWTGHDPGSVCRIRFESGNYPGFTLNEVARDWTGYTFLVFEVYQEEAETEPLLFRTEDREHNQAYNDRYNAVFRIPPGHTTIRIPLEDIRRAPEGREMDLTSMKGMTFFSDQRTSRPFTVYLDDVRLER